MRHWLRASVTPVCTRTRNRLFRLSCLRLPLKMSSMNSLWLVSQAGPRPSPRCTMSQLRWLHSTSSTLHAQILPSSQGAWSSLNVSCKNTIRPSRPISNHCPQFTSKSWVRWRQLRKTCSILTISWLRFNRPQRTNSSPIASPCVIFWPLRCKTSPLTSLIRSVKTEERAVKCANLEVLRATIICTVKSQLLGLHLANCAGHCAAGLLDTWMLAKNGRRSLRLIFC